MPHRHLLTVAITAIVTLLLGYTWLNAGPLPGPTARNDAAANETDEPDNLAIVWTSGDPDVAHRMALMYANGAKSREWFSNVRLVIWGPSQRLVVGDKDVQAYISRLQKSGVVVEACLACADSYGIADNLRSLGLEVKYMGEPLSEFLKSDDWAVISF